MGRELMIEAVIWDFGGVLTSSPFEAFARFETERGLPADIIRRTNANNHWENALVASLHGVAHSGHARLERHLQSADGTKMRRPIRQHICPAVSPSSGWMALRLLTHLPVGRYSSKRDTAAVRILSYVEDL
jgi:hypothetical protein